MDEDPTRARKQRLYRHSVVKRHGLKLREYEDLYTEQEGLCAICGEPETRTFRGQAVWLAVDHDHETDKIRGLLCDACNRMLGWLEKLGPDWLQAATRYLEKHNLPDRSEESDVG